MTDTTTNLNRTGPDAAPRAPSQTPVRRPSFDHGRRSRFNAWFFETFDRYLNHALCTHKDRAFAGLAGPVVVELGPGAGANLRRVPPGIELIGVEPNEQMHGRLRRRAAASGVRLRLVPGVAESLPLPDGSVDDIICSLVLCTVPDLDHALAEARRVLRPGGRLRFVEHIAAPRWSPRRWLQVMIRRPWSWVYEGCDPARETVRHVQAAGFTELTFEGAEAASLGVRPGEHGSVGHRDEVNQPGSRTGRENSSHRPSYRPGRYRDVR